MKFEPNTLKKMLGRRWAYVGDGMFIREPILKKARCCGVQYTKREFEDLEFVNQSDIEDDEYPPRYEWRMCRCGSSIAVGVDHDGNYCK